eukprot:14637651-Alexandrium_andersonii.AAC.1
MTTQHSSAEQGRARHHLTAQNKADRSRAKRNTAQRNSAQHTAVAAQQSKAQQSMLRRNEAHRSAQRNKNTCRIADAAKHNTKHTTQNARHHAIPYNTMTPLTTKLDSTVLYNAMRCNMPGM